MHSNAVTRTMDRSELKTVLSWASEEGWNPGVSDADVFHAADAGGFFLTCVDGAPVAAVSVVNHDSENAFLGLYICRPEWRGKGLGFATWQFGIKHAGSRSVGLDGVPEQESNYRESGFVKTGSTLRHQGRLGARKSHKVRSFERKDFPALMTLDGRANGFKRHRFLEAWLIEELGKRETRVLVQDGTICGFATWRACRDGTKIGPIIAPDLSASVELISDIAVVRSDGPLIIDVPEENGELRREFESAGFTVPFVTARMYRGNVPETRHTLQAIATMELG